MYYTEFKVPPNTANVFVLMGIPLNITVRVIV